MVTLFVSHSSQDQATTTRVADGLRAAGFAAVFVDFDPDRGIPAGRVWENEIYAKLRAAAAVVFLASAASVASPWCFAELTQARALGRKVFPVRLETGVWLPLLADLQWVDMGKGRHTLDNLIRDLLAAGLDPDDSFEWDERRPPFPGLKPFAHEDAAVFFGRRRETKRLTELLHPTVRFPRGRFVGIVGPSGSGKSSLLHAGLLPRLERRPQQWLVLPALVPGSHPIAALAHSVEAAFARVGHLRDASDLKRRLEGARPG